MLEGGMLEGGCRGTSGFPSISSPSPQSERPATPPAAAQPEGRPLLCLGCFYCTAVQQPCPGDPCLMRCCRENVLKNLDDKAFDKPICEALLNQKFFNGIGNYLRAEILYRLKIPPFEKARTVLENPALTLSKKLKLMRENPDLLELCHTVPMEVITAGEKKLFEPDHSDNYAAFKNWLQCYLVPGMSTLRDRSGRTVWFQVGAWGHCLGLGGHQPPPPRRHQPLLCFLRPPQRAWDGQWSWGMEPAVPKASYQHSLPGQRRCASQGAFPSQHPHPLPRLPGWERRLCSPRGCEPEPSDVLAREGIWWGRRGAPSSHSSSPVPISQCSAHASPGWPH
uniref:Nei like DNA glycosylase 1 n=1 Tax=Bubo bubo TaxID=30461 RepID=A0A8C0ES38_BUBBB